MFLLLAGLLAQATPAELDPTDPVLHAAVAELERVQAELAGDPLAPYFVAIEVIESTKVQVSAEDGALQGYSPSHGLHVDVDVRIGTPELDSSHALRSGRERRERTGRALPVTDDPALLQHQIWREVDHRTQMARERWGRVQSDSEVLVEEEPSVDLSPVEPVVDLGGRATLDLDLPTWEQTLRDASAVLGATGVAHDGAARLHAEASTHWVVTSEGTRVRHGTTLIRVSATGDTVAEDGARLRLYRTWDAGSVDNLPGHEAILDEVDAFAQLLADLREAPEQEPYTGPAILSDRAAAVFFHEIFGHRVEGHRLKHVDNAATFRSMVGEPILPEFLSIHDDPTLASLAGIDLRGHYRYDAEGVPAQPTPLVEDGVLVGFLQSRSPLGEGDTSNGHGRRQPGRDPVSRQGNLLVTASSSVDDAALRAELVERAEEEGLEYALFIDEIQGGMTFTSRGIPNAFKVDVLLAWRVYVDGRPDELVRGIDLIGTPLVTFSLIERAGELHAVFNGDCGAESGWVPVSGASPSLLVAQIETQRKRKDQDMPPLLPAPGREVAP